MVREVPQILTCVRAPFRPQRRMHGDAGPARAAPFTATTMISDGNGTRAGDRTAGLHRPGFICHRVDHLIGAAHEKQT
jgi:hypothetical protein